MLLTEKRMEKKVCVAYPKFAKKKSHGHLGYFQIFAVLEHIAPIISFDYMLRCGADSSKGLCMSNR